MINFKNLSVKRKLNYSFLLVITFSAVIMTSFSLFYFLGKIRKEVSYNMKKNLKVAELIYRNKENEVLSLTQSLANDRAVQVLTDLDIRNKLSEYVRDIVRRENVYNITILDNNLEMITSAANITSSIVRYNILTDFKENNILNKSIREAKTISGTELIFHNNEVSILSISAASPIFRDDKIAGYISVRYILNDDSYLIKRIKELLDIDFALYHAANSVISSDNKPISRKLYEKIIDSETSLEKFDIHYEGLISEYKTMYSIDKKPAAVVRLSIPSAPITRTILFSLLHFTSIFTACITLSFFLAFTLSKSILTPLNELLNNVNKIAEGDFSSEIITDLKDEIGGLNNAFNNMRVSLNDKISNIEHINEDLETTIAERTKTIQSLINKMKKSLPPQLYKNIIGNSSVAEIKKYARKKLTVVFAEIVNFSRISEAASPDEISKTVNNYLEAVSEIAVKWGGTIDKFTADKLIIFTGDTDFINDKEHTYQAAMMALDIRSKIAELRLNSQGSLLNNSLYIKIGINTGYCTVGNFGYGDRSDYTVIGLNVTLAEKLSFYAEANDIFISQDTYSLIRDKITCRSVKTVNAGGVFDNINIYRIIKSADADGSELPHETDMYEEKAVLPEIILSKSKDEKNDVIKNLRTALNNVSGKKSGNS